MILTARLAGEEMAKTNHPGVARPGRLRRLGKWLLLVLAMPGIVAVLDSAWPAGAGAPIDGEDRPFAQVADDELHSPVWALAFSPDGARRASSTISGDVWLFDDTRGLRTLVRGGQMNTVRSLAFSPDGRMLAIGGPGRAVRLVDAPSASELEPVEPEGEDNAAHVAISPDGRYLAAGGYGGTVTIWDRGSRRRLGALVGHAAVTALAFAPGGSTLAAGHATGRVRLWSIPGETARMTLAADAPPDGVTALAFSPDGMTLATAGKLEGGVRLWDPSAGRLRGTIPRTPAKVGALAFSPDGTVLAITESDGTALWSIVGSRELTRVRANGWGIQSVAFAPDGRSFATGGNDGWVRLWDLAQAIGSR
jgi:WD40 repeat protein